MSSSPVPSGAEGACGFELVNHGCPEVHLFHTLQGVIDLCTDLTELRGQTGGGLGDRELCFRGHVLRLGELFVRAKALDPSTVFTDSGDHLRLLSFQVGDDLIELDELLTDKPLALERLAGEVVPSVLDRRAGTEIELVELVRSAVPVAYHALVSR